MTRGSSPVMNHKMTVAADHRRLHCLGLERPSQRKSVVKHAQPARRSRRVNSQRLQRARRVTESSSISTRSVAVMKKTRLAMNAHHGCLLDHPRCLRHLLCVMCVDRFFCARSRVIHLQGVVSGRWVPPNRHPILASRRPILRHPTRANATGSRDR